MEIVNDAECQDIVEDIDVSQSFLCAGGDSKGVCFVSFQPQHFSSLCDLFRATVGVLLLLMELWLAWSAMDLEEIALRWIASST